MGGLCLEGLNNPDKKMQYFGTSLLTIYTKFVSVQDKFLLY